MNYWWILFAFDFLLFFFVALTVVYIFFFAIVSMFDHRVETPKAKRMNRFIVIIPAYKKDDTVLQTVNSVLGQSYPQRLFDVIVVSDHESEMTNMRLAQLPITLLTPDFDRSTKAKSMQYAILNLPQFKIFDAVLVLDADNLIEPEYLERLNDAFEAAGTKAVQTHRVSRNMDTSVARLDSIFEEINTSIFRRAHNTIGLSAALNGSGMAYDFEWFKSHIMKVRTAGEDKELEAMLLSEGVFIDYFDDLIVYDEKTRHIRTFNLQRGRWAATQLHALINNLRHLPLAIINRNYDYADKLLQWLIVPRTILMGLILVMSVVLPFVYFSLAVKWWVAGAMIMFAFAAATPNSMVTEKWDRDFALSPILVLYGLFNIIRVAIIEILSRFHSAKRIVHRMTPSRK